LREPRPLVVLAPVQPHERPFVGSIFAGGQQREEIRRRFDDQIDLVICQLLLIDVFEKLQLDFVLRRLIAQMLRRKFGLHDFELSRLDERRIIGRLPQREVLACVRPDDKPDDARFLGEPNGELQHGEAEERIEHQRQADDHEQGAPVPAIDRASPGTKSCE